MRPSIRLTLTLAFGGLLTVVLGIFGVVMSNAVQGSLAREMDRRLVVRASEIRLALWPGGQPADAEVFKRSDLDFSENKLIARLAFVQLVDTSGRVLAASDSLEPFENTLAPPPAGPVAEDAAPWFTDTTVLDGIPLRVLTVPLFSGRSMVGLLLVGQDRRTLQEETSRLASLLAILWATALAGGSLLAWITIRQGLAPLTAMARHAQRIAGERLFHERIAGATRADEVGWLVVVVNQLLATVESTLDQHRQFVADTSHELRNPLLTIQTNLDLLDRIDDPAERAACLRETRNEVQRMSRLVIDLLLLARGEEGLILERSKVALRELVYQAAHNAQRHTSGQHIEVSAPAEIEVSADEGRVHQILGNLIENALRHTPSGGVVRLVLRTEEGGALLAVRDTGAGIPPEDLPHVFERFYRRKNTPGNGSGLGLSIVKHLAEAHGGRVAAESTVGEGSCFSVWLPGARAPVGPAPQPVGAS